MVDDGLLQTALAVTGPFFQPQKLQMAWIIRVSNQRFAPKTCIEIRNQFYVAAYQATAVIFSVLNPTTPLLRSCCLLFSEK